MSLLDLDWDLLIPPEDNDFWECLDYLGCGDVCCGDCYDSVVASGETLPF